MKPRMKPRMRARKSFPATFYEEIEFVTELSYVMSKGVRSPGLSLSKSELKDLIFSLVMVRATDTAITKYIYMRFQ